MVTVTETNRRTLEGPDEITQHLLRRYSESMEGAKFEPGEAVAIVSRDGIPPDTGVGNVAIWLFAISSGAWSYVSVLTSGGIEIITQVPTANLGKRTAGEGEQQ